MPISPILPYDKLLLLIGRQEEEKLKLFIETEDLRMEITVLQEEIKSLKEKDSGKLENVISHDDTKRDIR